MGISYKNSTHEIIDAMWNKFGYLFCQHCKRSDRVLGPPHHIIFKSEIPSHPERHNVRNLILLCFGCHDQFHGKIKGFYKHEMRKELIKDRKLKELFNLSGDWKMETIKGTVAEHFDCRTCGKQWDDNR